MFKQVLIRTLHQIDQPEMYTYLFPVIFLLVLGLFYEIAIRRQPNNAAMYRLIFCFLATVGLAFFCGLRSEKVGTDSQGYKNIFETDHHVTPQRIFESLMPSTVTNIEVGRLPRDATFYFISDQLQFSGLSAYSIFCIYALFYVGVTGWLILRYSSDPLVSFFGFIAFGIYIFGFTGIRQSVAMGWTMLAFPYIEKKKFLYFLFFTMIAILFHKSAVLFLPAYFLCRQKFTMKWLIIAAVAFVILRVESPLISRLIVRYFGETDQRIQGYFGEDSSVFRTYTTSAIRLFFLLLYLFLRGRQPFTLRESILVKMLIVGTMMEALAVGGSSGLPRMALYYSAYITLFLPGISDRISFRQPIFRSLVLLLFFFLCSLYFMRVISRFGPYHFNWYGWVQVG